MDEVKKTDRLNAQELIRFVVAVNKLTTERNLSERQVIALFRIMTGFAHDLDAVEMVSLHAKGVIEIDDKGKVTVKEDFLWGDGEVIQLEMELLHESTPTLNKVALDLVKNIEKELCPSDEKEYKAAVTKIAREKFKYDLEMARYYYILQRIFPPLLENEANNPEWRAHFHVTPPTYTRRSGKGIVKTEFMRVFTSKTKDIAIFIVATYLYVKSTIKLNEDICYCTTDDKFMRNYTEWYQAAETHVKSLEVNRKSRSKRKITRKNKTDTL